uniref:NMDA receptor synaptonuclear signaling and neuronal migration factor n=1 Tax=Nothobranchius furzeri TaxID=105023 RepID=A0A8C6P9Z6_NOTFU
MGTTVSKRRNLRNDAISSVAAKVRAARAFGEYLSHSHPENRNGSAHLLCETLVGPDPESPSDTTGPNSKTPFRPCSTTKGCEPKPEPANEKLGFIQPPPSCVTIPTKPTCLSLERSFTLEEEQKRSTECALQPARVYTITTQHGMLMSSSRGSKESLELDVLKDNNPQQQQQQLAGAGSHSHHASHHHPHHHHHLSQPPLQTSVSAHNIRSLGDSGKGEVDCRGLACDSCSGAPSRSQGSLDLESASREAGKQHRRLERMWSVDRVTGLEREDTNWFPKENMFTFQTATTTMQAVFRGFVQRKRREREQDSAEVIQRNFRKHLRMVGSRRIKAQTFAERRSKSFSRSWSDPTPVKTDSPHEPKDSGDLQMSSGTLEEGGLDDSVDWEEEKEMERLACEGDDFIPPKIMLISSKVPKAEYVPNIIRRDDPSIIPILYDHEHATFDDILEEIEKKLTAYRRGSKFWRMLIFCQGGPGHLYLLKNKVATFAKVEKEEDMSQFWRRLSRFMSKINPEPNVIHIMGCYVLGNPNGEKLFQKLKNLMRPYSVEFESPLELSAQGKEMIEMFFDFRLYRLWKTRQHSKLLDYEDFL